MKVFLLWLALFSFCIPDVYGAGAAQAEKEQGRSDKSEKESIEGAQDKNPGLKERPEPQWPRPYEPSEQINADSIVPFPADI